MIIFESFGQFKSMVAPWWSCRVQFKFWIEMIVLVKVNFWAFDYFERISELQFTVYLYIQI